MNKVLSALLAASALLVLPGCSEPSQPTEEASSSAEKLTVITTFLPMTQFTQAVGGDRIQLTQLLPSNVDPHDYQAKPQDIQNLAEADLLIKNGLGLENFLDDLIANADNADLNVVDTSVGLAAEEAPENAKDIEEKGEAHGHDEHGHDEEEAHGHDEHGHDEEADAVTSGHNHDHGGLDPHIWLDPKQAIGQVENIRDGLIAADPAGAETYTQNAAAYISELQSLDSRITQALSPYAGQTFVTYHDFADHFAESYDLEVEHLVDIPEGSAAPSDVQRVIETVKASDLKTLLDEPDQENSQFEAIAADLDIRISEFDPIETSPSGSPSAEDYLTTMQQNADNLAAAFSGAPQP